MKHIATILGIHLFLVATYCLSLLEVGTVRSIGREDGPIENLGAVGFLIAATGFFAAYLRSESGSRFLVWNTHRNVFLLLLAAAFAFAAGEEISWGQRIFGWKTPEAIAKVNTQGETTLHNLAIFQERKLIRISRVFSLFWLSYCLVVPLLNRLRLPRRLFAYVGLPMPPVWVGTAMLTSWITFKLFAIECAPGVRTMLNELKEANYALCFAILAVVFVVHSIRSDASERTPDP